MRHPITRVFTGADRRSHFGELELAEHDVRVGVFETECLDASRARV